MVGKGQTGGNKGEQRVNGATAKITNSDLFLCLT